MRSHIKASLLITGLFLLTPLKAEAKEFSLLPYNTLEIESVFSNNAVQLLNSFSLVCDSEGLLDSLSSTNSSTMVNGMVSYQDNMVVIRDFPTRKQKDKVLYHELGHMLDIQYNISSNPYVTELMEKESDNMSNHVTELYFKSSEKEFIAETIALMIINPDEVQRLMPKTYKFIEDLQL